MYSFDKQGFDKTLPGGVAFGEVRYNFRRLPLDVGLLASAQIFSRSIAGGEKLDYISKNLMVVADYNYYRDAKLSFFAGLGVGVGFFDHIDGMKYVGNGMFVNGNELKTPLCFMPRIGMTVVNHFRISLAYLLEDRANSNLSLRLGYMF